ncbi:Bgt-20106 [Blumeria graminis f. sp. tritici]|uniref:Bgt-20106 n=1 Tax=Blumeria graminis f. sp. tritici TaxID=62690 RepID=A0A9X9LB56_BLUGR|nr:Bgt-20106 [Blumeria graminis f. sp. tritici]
MTGGNPEVTPGPLSDKIIDLANAHVKLDKEACRLKNEYDTLLEKNQDLANVNAKLKLQTKVLEISRNVMGAIFIEQK